MQGHCPQCKAQVVVLLPSVSCARCGHDLAPQVPADELADALYDLAAEQARQHNLSAALSVLEQGLTQVERSDLHLLAALLYRKRGDYEAMRRHVAAIPVHDALRGEAEWLLRDHQERMRREREQLRRERPPRPGRQPRNRSWRPTVGWLGVPAVLILVFGAFWWGRPWLAQFVAARPQTAPPAVRSVQTPERIPAEPQVTVVAPTATLPSSTSTPQALPTPSPGSPAQGSSAAARTSGSVPSATPMPSPSPSPSPTPEPSPWPSAQPTATPDLAEAIRATLARPVDLAAYLEAQGRPDLAALPVEAARLGSKIWVQGTVPFTGQRDDLLGLLAQYPGVREIDDTLLTVRLPEVYIVQPQDTLWTIASLVYGDSQLWRLLWEANREQLAEPGDLTPGMELVVPPTP